MAATLELKNLTDCPCCSGEGFSRIDDGDELDVAHTCYACGGTGLMSREEAAERIAQEAASAEADAKYRAFARRCQLGDPDIGDDYSWEDPLTATELAEIAHHEWHRWTMGHRSGGAR